MSNEREDFFQPLKFTDYNVAGNSFRAYYDMDDKLVFVVDFTINETKPNVLLVINPFGDRKWDDILMNDYGVDLETVRPKKDNKYQKLDIEYTGLAKYDALIRAEKDDEDLSSALAGLEQFRRNASYRAALERMAAAELTANRARETIEKTKESVQELQTKLKTLRGKLAAQRKNIGKEPTKQSAAKILRTESQIDSVNEKLARAKKRQINAQHRLSMAIDETEMVRQVMDALDDMESTDNAVAMPANTMVVPVQDGHDEVMVVEPETTDLVVAEDVPVPMKSVPDFATDDDSYEEDDYDEDNLEEDIFDEEVKPLFTEEPKVFNEDNAFQPVNLGAESNNTMPVANKTEKSVQGSDVLQLQPLTFAPPVSATPVEEDITLDQNLTGVAPAPMLDSLTAVQSPEEDKIDSELNADVAPVVAPVETEMVRPESPLVEQEQLAEPVQNVPETESAMPEIEPASDSSGLRPLSPVAEQTAVPATSGNAHRKPNVLYYGLLIVLIVMSVFTLWMYQRSLNDSVPDLGAKTQVVAEVSEEGVADNTEKADADIEEVEVSDSPLLDAFVINEPAEIAKEGAVTETDAPEEEKPVVQVMPMPMEVVQMAAADAKTDETEETTATDNEEIIEQSDVEEDELTEAEEVVVEDGAVAELEILQEDEVDEVIQESEDDVLAKKPEYGVNRDEAVLVAAPDYETDEPAIGTAVEPAYYQTEEDVTLPSDEEVVELDALLCEDGTEPDENGCCGDEVLEDVDGRMVCCSASAGECFDPLI